MAYPGKLLMPATKRRIKKFYIERFSTEELAIMYRVPENTIKFIIRGLGKYRNEKI